MKIKKKTTRKERAKQKDGQGQVQEPSQKTIEPISIGVAVHDNKVALKLSRVTDLIVIDIKAFWQMVEIVKMKAPKEPKVKGVRLYDAFGKEVQ